MTIEKYRELVAVYQAAIDIVRMYSLIKTPVPESTVAIMQKNCDLARMAVMDMQTIEDITGMTRN
jgi:hypothetical protein